MDQNEITMFMDVKVDYPDKRPESVHFREWARCQVRIEAVKCLPCFLRITLELRENVISRSLTAEDQKPKKLTISIIVPGVSINLANSRTRLNSYAVTWKQSRRNCCIYLGLDTDLACRRHMKWMRKSITNLELYRKIMLEDRRTSRGVVDSPTQGPVPLLPDDFDESNGAWPLRVSEIYEEIFEENEPERRDSKHLSRRCSRTSIASGIYEEMKAPFNASNNFESINEELFAIQSTPPPLPPLPPLRKRFNTYEVEETNATSPLETIPRSNTNPETEMAKKKKYRNVFENLFLGGGLRSKRTVSVSDSNKQQIAENTVTTPKTKEYINSETTEKTLHSVVLKSLSPTPFSSVTHTYANDDAIAAKRQKKPCQLDDALEKQRSKRNSFSSPDLSKINFVDTFDEQRIAELLSNSYSKCEDLDFVNNTSLNETELILTKSNCASTTRNSKFKTNILENNISQKIPNNFNFSACNSSTINLIAPLSTQPKIGQLEKNKIIFDDLSGYCVMAPIVKKMSAIDNTVLPNKLNCAIQPLESISSGYSTGSYSSSTSSCINSAEETNPLKIGDPKPKTIQEESIVYENMQAAIEPAEKKFPNFDTTAQKVDEEFTGSLYENLLAVKAAQELEQIPITNSLKINTSTPTDSPLFEQVTPNDNASKFSNIEEEDYYQTPRKSIISIDEKVPSYYPNTSESSVKSRRRSYSPARVNKNKFEKRTPETSEEKSPVIATTTPILRYSMNTKMSHERKENIYLASPQGAMEQRRKSRIDTSISPKINISPKNSKTKKTAARKISENVYTVTHSLKKSVGPHTNSNNNIENKLLNSEKYNEVKEDKLQNELLNLGILKNIDFKFEDPNVNGTGTLNSEFSKTTPLRAVSSPTQQLSVIPTTSIKETTLVNQSPAANTAMSQSTIANNENVASVDSHLTAGIKKFASLPRFKKFNLSPLRTRINNVLQRNHTPDL